MLRSSLLLSFVLFLTLPYPPSSAQTAAPPANPAPTTPVAPVMPKDPTELMQLAARVNGLDSPDMKPWHLKATYQTFDDAGNSKDQGTFEEWWAGHTKYKISYSSAGFNQIEYRNGADTRMTGDIKWPPKPEFLITQKLLNPLMSSDDAKPLHFAADKVKFGKTELKCLHLLMTPTPPMISKSSGLPAYCFAEDIPALRVESSFAGEQVVYNGTVSISGHYVSKQVRVLIDKHAFLNVDVVSLTSLNAISDADLAPPAGAALAPPRRIGLESSFVAENKLSGLSPLYPREAKQRGIDGTVVIHLVVTQTGETSELQVISGPAMLQKPALDAVKTWRYKPYAVNGEPVEVETRVNVIYTLGH